MNAHSLATQAMFVPFTQLARWLAKKERTTVKRAKSLINQAIFAEKQAKRLEKEVKYLGFTPTSSFTSAEGVFVLENTQESRVLPLSEVEKWGNVRQIL
jgi:hypothetical protein